MNGYLLPVIVHLRYEENFEPIDISRQSGKSEAALILYNLEPVILK
jgi:hypothetical protein